MPAFYSEAHRKLHDAFDTRRLADALHDRVFRSKLAPMDKKFVQTSDFFFLATVDHMGFPTVSHKGGAPGFVRILDDGHLCFPIYDGNGMFYSTGNIGDNSKIGMMFIDFERPRRLRLHGAAHLTTDADLMARYPKAQMVVQVELHTIFTNCPRYIHYHQRVAPSEYTPQAGVAPPVPEWKRVDYLQDALPERDKEEARKSGPRVSETEYRKNFWKGLD